MDTLQLSVTVVAKNTMQLKESMSKTQTTSCNNCNNKLESAEKEYPPPEKKKPSKTNMHEINTQEKGAKISR